MTHSIDNIYDELLKVAQASLYKAKIRDMDSGDVVSEAFILCNESNPSKEDFIHAIGIFCKKHRHDYLANIKEKHIHAQIIEKCCTYCHEVLPIALFKCVRDRVLHFQYYRNYCKECENKKRREWTKLVGYWKTDERKEKQRAVAKKYWEREKNKLSDKYIYHRLLRRHLKKEEITNGMIEQRRNQILQKRRKSSFGGVVSHPSLDVMFRGLPEFPASS